MEKLLVSQILVDGKLQRVEFESLPAVCFSCGCYGNLKDICPSNGPDLNFAAGKEQVSCPGVVKPASARMGDSFGPWTIVERKSCQNQKENRNQKPKLFDKELSKSCFEALNSLYSGAVDLGDKFQRRVLKKKI